MARDARDLQLRGSVWWLRVRVPNVLRTVVGKTEIKKSLRTGDRKEAERLARFERYKLDMEWAAHRRQVTPAVVESLSEADLWNLTAKWFQAEDGRALSQDPDSGYQSFTDADRDLEALKKWDVAVSTLANSADALLAAEGWLPDRSSDSYGKLLSKLQSAMIEVQKRSMRRQFPGVEISLDPEYADLVPGKILKPFAKLSLKALIQTYRNDATRPPIRGKTAVKREAQYRIIEAYFGSDTPVASIDRAQARLFMDFVKKLPSNASKHFPNATIFEAAELGAAKSLPALSIDTANDYMRTLGSLFRFAHQEGHVASDPTPGLLINGPKVRAKDKRLPFDDSDLKAIFAAPLYRGCLNDEAGYSKPGRQVVRRGRFWVPLISLFTGMRQNEICQLTLSDFVTQDGVEVILIGDTDDETKRVKTEAGKRFVPVHPELVRIGLLTFVEDLRRKHPPSYPLFPELPAGTTGYRSDPYSKFFARFLDKVGVTDKKKVFHSFRHSYRDALREADISIEKVRALGGWSTGRTEDDYGSGLRATTLADAISKVGYPNLDLSFLHQAAAEILPKVKMRQRPVPTEPVVVMDVPVKVRKRPARPVD